MDNEKLIMYLDGLPQDTYVLHGAKEKQDVLYPAFPHQPNLIEEYNLCAVYGTLCTEISILYAVIHEEKTNWGWKIYPKKTPSLCVYGPPSLKGGLGYIHILERSDFTQVIEPGLVCLAFTPVRPLEVIEIQPTILESLQRRRRLRCL